MTDQKGGPDKPEPQQTDSAPQPPKETPPREVDPRRIGGSIAVRRQITAEKGESGTTPLRGQRQPSSRNGARTMGKLSDILGGSSGDFADRWNKTVAAIDYGPVPRGVYECHATMGKLESSQTNRTPGYQVEFTVIDGDYSGRKLWSHHWLTLAALAASKRDLAKLGITEPKQMQVPLPEWFRCRVTVVIRRDNEGIERNEVRTFEVIGFEPREPDPFAPTEPDTSGSPVPDLLGPSDADMTAAEPAKHVDPSRRPSSGRQRRA